MGDRRVRNFDIPEDSLTVSIGWIRSILLQYSELLSPGKVEAIIDLLVSHSKRERNADWACPDYRDVGELFNEDCRYDNSDLYDDEDDEHGLSNH